MGGFLRREVSDVEREQLQAWLRSEDKVKFLRARIVVLADTTPNAAVIARTVGVHVQTVRDVARVFWSEGVDGLAPKPRTGRPRTFDAAAAEALVAILHESPEEHGGDDGRWTLAVAAKALAERLHRPSVSVETVRCLLRRHRYSWQRAKEWITSPDPQYAFKKNGVTG